MKDNRVKIEKWIDDKSTEYDFKVLIYGNYTYRKNLGEALEQSDLKIIVK